jgi:hypothetical protein
METARTSDGSGSKRLLTAPGAGRGVSVRRTENSAGFDRDHVPRGKDDGKHTYINQNEQGNGCIVSGRP